MKHTDLTSDDERRRVTRKLREYASWDGEEDCLVDCADWGERVLNLLGCGDTEGECYKTLADLIDPHSTIPTDPGEAGLASVEGFIREMRHSTEEEQSEYRTMLEKISVELHPVDRDALLALADEMDRDDDMILNQINTDPPYWVPSPKEYARRIREACGANEWGTDNA